MLTFGNVSSGYAKSGDVPLLGGINGGKPLTVPTIGGGADQWVSDEAESASAPLSRTQVW